MTMFAVRYLNKLMPTMGLFSSQDLFNEWVQQIDPERASSYEAVPMRVNS